MVYVAAKLGIADLLSAGPRTSEELAAATRAHPQSLQRLLRALASVGIFAEDADGCFELTPMAECLRIDAPASLHSFAVSYGEPWWWGSWGDLLHSVRTGHTAFMHRFHSGLFDYLERDPEAAAIFNANMTSMTRQEGEAIASAYDFAGTRVLVDIGCGHGALAAAILRRWPQVRAILFDQHAVLEGARREVRDHDFAARCELVAGDFFEAIPRGGDTYTIKDVLHDWNDDRALSILQSCRAAMGPESKLLVLERVILPGNDPSPGKLIDINMLVLMGGRERTGAEYRELLQAAGFEPTRIVPTRTGVSVIEAVPVERE
jgi:precorrin-6B methylase 2